jgi:hypothetical protein
MMDQRIEKAIFAKLNQLSQEGTLATKGYTSPEIIVLDGEGKMQAQTLIGAPTEEAANYLQEYLHLVGASSTIKEACLILDCYAESGQETTLPDILVILHSATKGGYEVGIIEYDARSSPLITKPINWQDHFWSHSLAPLGRQIFSHFATGASLEPAGCCSNRLN